MLSSVATDVGFKLQETNTLRQSADNFCSSSISNASKGFFVNSNEEHRSWLVATGYSLLLQLLFLSLG